MTHECIYVSMHACIVYLVIYLCM